MLKQSLLAASIVQYFMAYQKLLAQIWLTKQ